MRPVSLLRNIFKVGVWTLASRILGLLREIMLFAVIGPGPVMDAFIAAFRLPNLFRRFFAEGAFNAAFVPMFSKRLEEGDDPKGFAREAASGLAFVLIILSILAIIFMPWLVRATADGFSGTEKFAPTVAYARVMFPYILFISLAALFSGMLNSAGHFTAAAAAPVLLNILMIGALGAAWVLEADAVVWLTWVVPLAGIAQLGLVFVAAQQAGISVVPTLPRWTPRMRNLVLVALPAMLSGGVLQVNLLVGQQVASHYDNAVSWLWGADRLYQLPLGMVGIAVGIVLLPDLSRRLKAGDVQGSRTALTRAGQISMGLALPAAVALIVVPLPLLSAVYERGATSANDISQMAQALVIYGIGLPAFMGQKLVQPLYYAREDTRRPFNFALWSMAINALIAIGGSIWIGWVACAWATTISAWAMLALLVWGARNMGDTAQVLPEFWRQMAGISAAALGMGGVLFVSVPYAMQFGGQYGGVLLLILLGALSYGALCQFTGGMRIGEIKRALRR